MQLFLLLRAVLLYAVRYPSDLPSEVTLDGPYFAVLAYGVLEIEVLLTSLFSLNNAHEGYYHYKLYKSC